jgi:D-glycero-D-manno-heptose 1,7-bisphosphate phosphatase
MRQAVFLDRDGTLIRDRGFLSQPSEVSFYSSTIEALRLLQDKFDLFIVTNQNGIADGFITMADVERVNGFIVDTFSKNGIEIKAVFVCPHDKSGKCKCRKPQPLFAEQAALTYNLDLSKSYAIGDHLSDVNFGKNFGGQGLYVLTGHGRHEYHLLPDDVIVVKDILSAARRIIKLKKNNIGDSA